MTSRELVYRTLDFQNTDGRVPRDLWVLRWATDRYAPRIEDLSRQYPVDFAGPPTVYKQKSAVECGDQMDVGRYVDPWGCVFTNIQRGVVGEIKDPLVPAEDEDWEDISRIHFPEEWFSFDVDQINEFCASTDKFVKADCCPRPFEQLQFIRGTENFFVDLQTRPEGLMKFIPRMHEFYCELLEKWCRTDVDALYFMDDWGSQNALLINPVTWVELFKPMYRDYINIAHAHGKKIFMHSDGHILAIIPHLIELGLDALNSQLFCMGVQNLAPYKGKITFWGEICRQHLLPHGTEADIKNAVTQVYDTLWSNGGCIAQCEFGPGANPDNVEAVYRTWDELRK